MFRFSLRELALLMAVVAVVLAWWIENRRATVLHRQRDAAVKNLQIANQIIQSERRRPDPNHHLLRENELLRENLRLILELRQTERRSATRPVGATDSITSP